MHLFAQVQVANGVGEVSLSAQWARESLLASSDAVLDQPLKDDFVLPCPLFLTAFDAYYEWNNATYMKIPDEDKGFLNTHKGGATQQTTSIVGITNQECVLFFLPPILEDRAG